MLRFKTLRHLFVLFLFSLISACGGGDDAPANTNPAPAPTAEVSVQVLVSGTGGEAINEASVTLDTESGNTDSSGELSLLVAEGSTPVTVQVSKSGFVSQSVQLVPDQDSIVNIRLLPVKQTIALNNIEQSQFILGESMGTMITLPEAAFLDESGNPATGSASLHLTAWDITSDEMSAMLGGGQAVDLAGSSALLISAGMMTIDFTDATGAPLQLAAGRTATIQMDLPQTSINNTTLMVGSEIPLWTFDEQQGLWREDPDGPGVVVQSATSPVGLAVQATVSHFSTWNWDFKSDNSSSIFVQCQSSDTTPLPCALQAKVTLADNSISWRAAYAPATGIEILNIPADATIDWDATSTNGLHGTATSASSGAVTITMSEPSTTHFVQCELPAFAGGGFAGCIVTFDPMGIAREYNVPAQGATIYSYIDPVPGSINWSAVTSQNYVSGINIVTYSGEETSAASGNVPILLATENVLNGIARNIQVQCVNTFTTFSTCDLEVFTTISGTRSLWRSTANTPVNQVVGFPLPEGLSGNDYIEVRASDPSSGQLLDNAILFYRDMVDGEFILMRLGDLFEG